MNILANTSSLRDFCILLGNTTLPELDKAKNLNYQLLIRGHIEDTTCSSLEEEPGPNKKQRLSLSLGKKGKKDNRFASPIKVESLERVVLDNTNDGQ